jgi:copper resistance protein B
MGHCKLPAKPPQAQQPEKPAAPAAPSCTAEHAAMGHCKLPVAPTPAPKAADPAGSAPAAPCSPEHAAMGHCTLAPAAPSASPPAAGRISEASGTNLPAGNAPAPPVPAADAADGIFGREAMGMGRHHLSEHHGAQKFYQVMANIAEYQIRKGRNSYEWDGSAWYGGDINRLWLKSEGEGVVGRSVESAEIQALYSRAFSPYFNVQGGIRYDVRPRPNRGYAVLGVEGLAPSFFDVEGRLFLSNKGELFARAEGYYDQRITQRLILQPSVELNFAAQNRRELGIGAGLSDLEVGARLRYDIRREFSPYIGVQYQRAFGRTARYLRDDGEDAGGFQLLVGVRAWF